MSDMDATVPVLLTIIAVVALVGNMFVVIMFIKNIKWLKKAHNCLILALATQDILIAIGLFVLPWFIQPPDAYVVPSDPTFRKIYCSLIWSQYFPFSLGVASVYTCLMLTIERWFAVVKPMTYRRIANDESPKIICAMVVIPWLVGFGLELNGPMTAKGRQNQDGSHECYWKAAGISSAWKTFLSIFTLFGTILVPSVLMIVAYVQIIVRIKRSSNRVSRLESPEAAGGGTSSESREFRSLKLLTRMVFGASVIVIVCWLPDQIYYALSQVGQVKLGTTAHYIVKILAFANSVFNPFLYSFSNERYRREFKAFFPFCFGRQESGD